MTDSTSLAAFAETQAIRDLALRFAEAVTLNDAASFRSLWTDDAQWSIGQPPRVDAHGRDEIAATLQKLRGEREFFIQFAFPGTVHVAGDGASMTCLYHEAARGPGETYYRNHCLSRDRLRRIGGVWRFSSRRYYYLWLDTSPFTGQTFPDFADHPF